jgi:uncharacterized membrane protein
MAWLGLILGAIVGGLGWGWSGAVVLAFIGWLAGIIIGSKKQAATPTQTTVVKPAPQTPDTRLERLEKTVAALEARLARLEVGGVEAPVAPAPLVPSPAEEETLPPVVPIETVEAPPEIPAPPPPPPRPPAKPNPIIAWFTAGNAIVRVGAVVLFFGLVFLLNYAREHELIAPEFRVAGVAAVGLVLLAIGWRLRKGPVGYAVSLQGAGVAVLYLTVFAAMHLYGLISPEAAFVLLALVAVSSAFIAVAQDSLALAVIGAGGGFLAPILASTGSGNHVALFGYYLVLNVGIVAIAWFKAWRALNVVGFLFTFLIGLAWGLQFYEPEKFSTTEPFLVTFFLLYIAIAILFARSAGTSVRGPNAFVDATIVFGTPLAAFGLQAGMLHEVEFGLAYSSLGAAFVYLSLAIILHRERNERFALLAEAFLALGVVFATLAIPFALDARWTSAAWALEGAAIVWIGLRQDRKLARAFGLLLQLGAGVAYVDGFSRMPAETPLVDAPFIGALLVAFAGLWTNRLLGVAKERVTGPERALTPFLFVWGLAWLLFAGIHEIETFLPKSLVFNAQVMWFSTVALAFAFVAAPWRWREARWPGLALVAVLAFMEFVVLLERAHPFADYGWIAWPFALAALMAILWEADHDDPKPEARPFLHIGAFLVAGTLGAAELHWLAEQETARRTAWSVASVLVVPGLLVLLASSRWAEVRWPVKMHAKAYRYGASVTVLAAMAVWILYANATHDGRSDPLPYLPILNAIDLGHVFIAICAFAAALALRRSSLEVPPLLRGQNGWITIGALAFIWLNGILLRSVHHWADVPYRLQPMMRSFVAQTSLSIFWSVIALTMMVYATRSRRRNIWMTGAALMGVVVVKLFLVDLSHIAGIERIISFIGVGVLMLVIGYFSPVPPRKAGESA